MAKNIPKTNTLLKQIRQAHDLSCLEVANKVGICKAYYWQIENGHRRIYYDLAIKIAAVFNKKPDDLFYDYYK